MRPSSLAVCILLLILLSKESEGGRRRPGKKGGGKKLSKHLDKLLDAIRNKQWPRGGGRRAAASRSKACRVLDQNNATVDERECKEGLICTSDNTVSLTQGEQTATYQFCNDTFEIKEKMACKVEEEDGTLIRDKQHKCLVGTCDAGPVEHTTSRGRGRGRNRGTNQTRLLYFCGEEVPDRFDYRQNLLKKACTVRYENETIITENTCGRRRRPEPCSTDGGPILLDYSGRTLQLFFCKQDNIYSFFGFPNSDGNDENDDDEGDGTGTLPLENRRNSGKKKTGGRRKGNKKKNN